MKQNNTKKILWSGEELEAITQGTWLSGEAKNVAATGVSYIIPYTEPGDLIFTTSPEEWSSRYHDTLPYIDDAFKAKAAVVIVDKPPSKNFLHPVLLVKSTREALDQIAKAARNRFQGKVICVTGSVGKSSTKKALSFVLGQQAPTYATIGNSNSKTGVPLSVAQTPSDYTYAVYETSMSYGDGTRIKSLLTRPHAAIITEIQPEHLNHIGSLEAIAHNKAMIFDGLEPNGFGIINHDNPFYQTLYQLAKEKKVANILSFGKNPKADIRLLDYHLDQYKSKASIQLCGQKLHYEIGIPGFHILMNSLSVLGAVYAVKADIKAAADALKYLKPVVQHNIRETIKIEGGSIELIDDTYSLSPASIRAGCEFLKLIPIQKNGRRIVVLNDMQEMGKYSKQLHAELAPVILNNKIDKIFTSGKEIQYLRDKLPAEKLGPHSENIDELIEVLQSNLRANDVVYLKLEIGPRSQKCPIKLIEHTPETDDTLKVIESLKYIKKTPISKNQSNKSLNIIDKKNKKDVTLIDNIEVINTSSVITPTSTLWFDHLNIKPTLLNLKIQEELLNLVKKNELFGKFLDDKKYPHLATLNKQPVIFFVTYSTNSFNTQSIISSDNGILSCFKKIMSDITKLKTQIKFLRLDVVKTMTPINLKNNNYIIPNYEHGVHGIALKNDKIAFLADELLAHHLVQAEGKINFGNLQRYIEKNKLLTIKKSDIDNIYLFDCYSLFSHDKISYPLYRSNQTFNSISKQMLLEACISGGEYLIKACDQEGKFIYSYLPKTNSIPEEYNILRHAGTMYALLELFEATKDERFFSCANQAGHYLQNFIKEYNNRTDKIKAVVENNFIKLGGNALSILAFCKFTEISKNNTWLTTAKQLAEWILLTQNMTGEYAIHKERLSSHKISDFHSDYYPGEAIFALTHLYRHTQDQRFLESAVQGAHYLINIRDHNMGWQNLPHDHWFLYGLNELVHLEQNAIFISHALKISASIIAKQYRKDDIVDWLGSFSNPPRSTPTAIRAEGLCAAFHIAKDFDLYESAEKMLMAIKLCVQFQLKTQFRPESILFLSNPENACGGFRCGLTNYEIRIDYVQHNISAMLGLIKIMTQEGLKII